MARLFEIADGPAREVTGVDRFGEGGSTGLQWLHVDGRDAGDHDWLAQCASLPDMIRSALLARETRPRTEFVDDGALVNLRGPGATPEDDPDPLTSIRFFAEQGRLISVSYRTSAALDPVIAKFLAGALDTPVDIIAEFAREMSAQLDPKVAEMGDSVDFCETRLDVKRAHAVRRRVSKLRSHAIAYRRFIVPQLHALERLSAVPADWIEDDDRQHLREAMDRFARMAEELEAVRERSALISEELTDLRSEQMDRRGLLLWIVALVFLPVTFITGLLGMNVGGLPFQGNDGFWIVSATCAIIGLIVFGWFAHAHWVRDR